MNLEARQFIFMGINYVTLPTPDIDKNTGLKFQAEMISVGVEFDSVVREENRIMIQRRDPFPLDIRVAREITQPQPFGQLLILAPNPNRALRNFASEAHSVAEAFNKTWFSRNRQILSSDVTLRCLYPSTSEHAFKELWEKRLKQPRESLHILGDNVLGGGLRFVIPPKQTDSERIQIEVKIESFLRDSKKMFVETQFFWLEPQAPGNGFDPAAKLNAVNDYIINQVHTFLKEGEL
jgi:hypothetical protein